MTEEAKLFSAVLSAVFAIMGIFVLGIILEPLALVAGIIGATSKKTGVKITGFASAVLSFILLVYLIIVLATAASVLSSL